MLTCLIHQPLIKDIFKLYLWYPTSSKISAKLSFKVYFTKSLQLVTSNTPCPTALRYTRGQFFRKPFFFSFFFVTLPEAPAGSCILLVSSLPCRRSRRVLYLTRFFFLLLLLLLATLLRLISQSCLDRFQPDLVTRTPDPAPIFHTTSLGSKVM